MWNGEWKKGDPKCNLPLELQDYHEILEHVSRDVDGCWIYLDWGRYVGAQGVGSHLIHTETWEEALPHLDWTELCECAECTAHKGGAK